MKLCGVESNGMICAADTPDGAASVIFPDQDLPCGAKLRYKIYKKKGADFRSLYASVAQLDRAQDSDS